jgi:hypothetical protein
VTEQVVSANPTKRFFVDMLTRDIQLKDAVLDLLDNCIDGILRQRGPEQNGPEQDGATPYDGYWAEIAATPDKFEIIDNCGGIPVDVAKDYAFMFGNPDLGRDAELKTVGLYGLGMKRAMFKIGGNTVVLSQPDTGPYEVAIPPDWLEANDDWELTLRDVDDGLAHAGTKITTSDLWPSISRQFDEVSSPFLSDLRHEIARFYALIIRKGFRVSLNGSDVSPVAVTLLGPESEDWTEEPTLAPYAFSGSVRDVNVDLVVGFYRTLASEQQIDEESESPRTTSHKAGWTVVCNDRVVLYGDRSMVTGWGRGTVPRFHNQFLSIAGVVSFESTDSMALPLNTTKRGLDTSSEVYLAVLDYMQEGMKHFTNFTNRWKSREDEVAPAFEAASGKSLQEFIGDVPEGRWQQVARIRADGGQARRFQPNLPGPEDTRPNRRISFSRPIEAIRKVSMHLFDDPEVTPREVGERVFDDVHRETEQSNG